MAFKASLKFPAERAGYKTVTTQFLGFINSQNRGQSLTFLGSINPFFPRNIVITITKLMSPIIRSRVLTSVGKVKSK